MKKKIILIGGYSASGKSTFSHKLSEELNIPCFNKDIIKETLGDSFGAEGGLVFEKGSNAAFMLILQIIESFLGSNSMCIIDSNFTMEELNEINILLEKYNGSCLIYKFTADLDILFDREIKRSPQRHWVHKRPQSNSNEERKLFKQIMLDKVAIEEADKIGQTVIVDTTSFNNINYEELFDTAKNFIK